MRRVVAAESVKIIGGHSGFVPVKLLFNSVSQPIANWLTQVAVVDKKAMAPRVLLNDCADNVLKIVNPGDKPLQVRRGSELTVATPVPTCLTPVPPNSAVIWSAFASLLMIDLIEQWSPPINRVYR